MTIVSDIASDIISDITSNLLGDGGAAPPPSQFNTLTDELNVSLTDDAGLVLQSKDQI